MSARKDLYHYISNNGLRIYSTEELRAVGKISEWARVLRQLKQDAIIDYENDVNGYNIILINELISKSVRDGLSSKDKYRIRHRDGHRCQSCGKGVSDNVKLHVDHKIPLDWGGGNDDSNLWTLCNECNLAKRNFFKDDFDPEVMRLVYNQINGYNRLKVLFENSPNKKFPPSILQGIAGIRDWTRTIRAIKNKLKLNIVWIRKEDNYPDGYYVYIAN
ncbi:HNH endonuclease [Sphingobacterium tabacisoli]|uniref:HNH endonuclease n=1 Tax=Sphingobacterium tabacisoli TaxID=2044855 RepID=A0ABW5L0M8_9SPHI|nr:HNH endonuclease [Sphingobacterium tabacisoli]